MQDAGFITDEALNSTSEKCKPLQIYKLYQSLNNLIKEKLYKIYPKKFAKDIAFPICISVYEVYINFTQLSENSEDEHEYKALSEGAMVKVSLGVEINEILFQLNIQLL